MDANKALQQHHELIKFKVSKTYKAVNINTLSNWVQHTLKMVGVNITTFGAGSTLVATTSNAAEQGAQLDVVTYLYSCLKELSALN